MLGLLGLWAFPLFAQYNGTGAVTQGLANTFTSNLYDCINGRMTRLGNITASNNTTWIVPAEVHFTENSFPFASDLHNACIGANYANASAALAALNGSDIVTIDADGELITAFVFADNYFEMYINGVAVGKDNVPFTQFNSNIVRFRVKRPFTIAMLLVDWEENLGLGSELNGGFAYHPGDGGMVAVFKNSDNQILAVTDQHWKAQTFYTAPITDLSCPTENGTQRLSGNCSTANSNNGSAYYALHWARPANWQMSSFNDADWPSATAFTNAEIGVNNKPAYTNFTDIFDDPVSDARFIWSSNVILDNEVIVRYTVPNTTSTQGVESQGNALQAYPNPFSDHIYLKNEPKDAQYELINAFGQTVYSGKNLEQEELTHLPAGFYLLKISGNPSSSIQLFKL